MNTSTASAHVRRQRRAVLLAASLVALSYYAHQRRWLTRLRCALAPLSEAAGAYGEAARESGRLLRRVTADLSSFLESDGRAEVPASLRQLLRLAQCAEAQEAVSRLSTALSSGVAAGVSQAVARQGDARGVLDGVLEAASSERGRSLLAVLVSAASRQAVVAGMEASERRARQQPGAPFHADTFERLLGELDSDRGRRVAQGTHSNRALTGLLCPARRSRSPPPLSLCRRHLSAGARRGGHVPVRDGGRDIRGASDGRAIEARTPRGCRRAG